MMLFLLAALLLAPAPAPAGPSLRVATFNIRYGTAKDGENRWEKRRGLLIQTIKDMDPDMIGMQEVLAFQLDELKTALPGYEFVGIGRNDGKREGEAVPVGFKAAKFEKVDAGHFWLSETPEVVGSKGWDAALPRMATWVRLKERSSGKPLLFVNTHFDHLGPKARTESAKLLRARAEKLREGGRLIVVGDFNATDDEPPYAALLEKKDDASTLVDSFREVHAQRSPDEGTFHDFKGGLTGRRIDWILHTKDLAADSSEVVHASEGGHYPSDHFPVLSVMHDIAVAK